MTMSRSSILPNSNIIEAFKGTSFESDGESANRNMLLKAAFQVSVELKICSTLTAVLRELGLMSKDRSRLTKSGRQFLRELSSRIDWQLSDGNQVSDEVSRLIAIAEANPVFKSHYKSTAKNCVTQLLDAKYSESEVRAVLLSDFPFWAATANNKSAGLVLASASDLVKFVKMEGSASLASLVSEMSLIHGQ